MALEKLKKKKKGHFVCALHFPILVIENPLPLVGVKQYQ